MGHKQKDKSKSKGIKCKICAENAAKLSKQCKGNNGKPSKNCSFCSQVFDNSIPYKDFPPPAAPEGGNDLWELQFCRWWGWNWVRKQESGAGSGSNAVQMKPCLKCGEDHPSPSGSSGPKRASFSAEGPEVRPADYPSLTPKEQFKEICRCILGKNKVPPWAKELYNTPSASTAALKNRESVEDMFISRKDANVVESSKTKKKSGKSPFRMGKSGKSPTGSMTSLGKCKRGKEKDQAGSDHRSRKEREKGRSPQKKEKSPSRLAKLCKSPSGSKTRVKQSGKERCLLKEKIRSRMRKKRDSGSGKEGRSPSGSRSFFEKRKRDRDKDRSPSKEKVCGVAYDNDSSRETVGDVHVEHQARKVAQTDASPMTRKKPTCGKGKCSSDKRGGGKERSSSKERARGAHLETEPSRETVEDAPSDHRKKGRCACSRTRETVEDAPSDDRKKKRCACSRTRKKSRHSGVCYKPAGSETSIGKRNRRRGKDRSPSREQGRGGSLDYGCQKEAGQISPCGTSRVGNKPSASETAFEKRQRKKQLELNSETEDSPSGAAVRCVSSDPCASREGVRCISSDLGASKEIVTGVSTYSHPQKKAGKRASSRTRKKSPSGRRLLCYGHPGKRDSEEDKCPSVDGVASQSPPRGARKGQRDPEVSRKHVSPNQSVPRGAKKCASTGEPPLTESAKGGTVQGVSCLCKKSPSEMGELSDTPSKSSTGKRGSKTDEPPLRVPGVSSDQYLLDQIIRDEPSEQCSSKATDSDVMPLEERHLKEAVSNVSSKPYSSREADSDVSSDHRPKKKGGRGECPDCHSGKKTGGSSRTKKKSPGLSKMCYKPTDSDTSVGKRKRSRKRDRSASRVKGVSSDQYPSRNGVCLDRYPSGDRVRGVSSDRYPLKDAVKCECLVCNPSKQSVSDVISDECRSRDQRVSIDSHSSRDEVSDATSDRYSSREKVCGSVTSEPYAIKKKTRGVSSGQRPLVSKKKARSASPRTKSKLPSGLAKLCKKCAAPKGTESESSMTRVKDDRSRKNRRNKKKDKESPEDSCQSCADSESSPEEQTDASVSEVSSIPEKERDEADEPIAKKGQSAPDSHHQRYTYWGAPKGDKKEHPETTDDADKPASDEGIKSCAAKKGDLAAHRKSDPDEECIKKIIKLKGENDETICIRVCCCCGCNKQNKSGNGGAEYEKDPEECSKKLLDCNKPKLDAITTLPIDVVTLNKKTLTKFGKPSENYSWMHSVESMVSTNSLKNLENGTTALTDIYDWLDDLDLTKDAEQAILPDLINIAEDISYLKKIDTDDRILLNAVCDAILQEQDKTEEFLGEMQYKTNPENFRDFGVFCNLKCDYNTKSDVYTELSRALLNTEDVGVQLTKSGDLNAILDRSDYSRIDHVMNSLLENILAESKDDLINASLNSQPNPENEETISTFRNTQQSTSFKFSAKNPNPTRTGLMPYQASSVFRKTHKRGATALEKEHSGCKKKLKQEQKPRKSIPMEEQASERMGNIFNKIENLVNQSKVKSAKIQKAYSFASKQERNDSNSRDILERRGDNGSKSNITNESLSLSLNQPKISSQRNYSMSSDNFKGTICDTLKNTFDTTISNCPPKEQKVINKEELQKPPANAGSQNTSKYTMENFLVCDEKSNLKSANPPSEITTGKAVKKKGPKKDSLIPIRKRSSTHC